MAPLATRAEYSPRLRPATASGMIPWLFRTSVMAMDTVSMAGWVFSVRLSSSMLPAKHSSSRSFFRVLDALSNTFLADS